MNKKMINNSADKAMDKRLCINDLKETILKKEKEGDKPKMVSVLGICEECQRAGLVFYLEN